MVSQLLDTCGRFLYRSPETHVRTKYLLEVMMRKKGALALDERQHTMLANSFYYCNPPEKKAIEAKVRQPVPRGRMCLTGRAGFQDDMHACSWGGVTIDIICVIYIRFVLPSTIISGIYSTRS